MFILYFSKYSWALFWDAVNLLENSLTFCASLLSRFWPVLSLWLIILYYWGRASGRLQSPWALQAGPVNALLSMAMLSLLCMLTPPLCGFFPHKPPSVISWILHALSLQTLNSLSACVVLSFLRLCPVMSTASPSQGTCSLNSGSVLIPTSFHCLTTFFLKSLSLPYVYVLKIFFICGIDFLVLSGGNR